MINLKNEYDIVIVDSGVNLKHPILQGREIDGFAVNIQSGVLQIDEDYQDYYGHGTAIYSIISKAAPDAKILNIKVLNQDDGSLTCEQLILTLRYIYQHISCRIINLSLGLRSSQHKKELHDICLMLKQKDVILVSAFDNEGCISYPAAFDCVIGVETSEKIKQSVSFEFVKDSIVNVRAKGTQQKIPWVKPLFVLFGGNSIACAYVTSIIYTLTCHEKMGLDKLMHRLEEKAAVKTRIHYMFREAYPDDYFTIQRASLFPFNKEMHALIRFRQSLPFDIISVHDVKYSGKIGSSCHRLIGDDMNVDAVMIQNVTDIPWEDIDTLILGHCEQLNQVLEFDIRYELICEAISHHVNIYSFDPLHCYPLLTTPQHIKIYWPQLSQRDVPHDHFNKLYHIDKPVITIAGTSSKQGKYTLQNTLKQLFISNSYHVGCISTEPNGHLLGMDYTFPLGYQALLDITDHQKIQIVNQMVHKLCENNDVILAAGQANSIPFASYMLDTFPVKQNAFLMGLQSDLIVLCVNPFDGIDYIHYTIQYLEGISQCKVCSLVLFPMTYYHDWRGMYGAKRRMNDESISEHCSYLEKALSLPCYSLNNHKSIVNLFNLIIEQLSEEPT